MTSPTASYPEQISLTVSIHASAAKIWEALTIPALMQQWILDTKVEIETTWAVGSPIIMRVPWYKKMLENKGTVLAFEPEHRLSYTHLSSISRLPDREESYTTLAFALVPEGNTTRLTLTLSNFPTESIFKHLEFYWRGTLQMLKERIEQQAVD